MSKGGFTLIEMLVIIAILAIAASIAIPVFSRWMPRYRLKSAATDLFSNMQLVRFGAIKQHTNSSITFSTSPHQYQYTHPTSGTLITVVLGDYGSGVYFHGPSGQTFSTSPITFNSRGLSNQGYAYLSNQNNSAFYRVGPLSSGVILLRKWNGSAWE
jgi:prepilin-type N-terminal cleavage/methylation domain-containing protein